MSVKITLKTTDQIDVIVYVDSSQTVEELSKLGAKEYDKTMSKTGSSFTQLLYHGEVMKPESKLCEYILNETECTVLAILPSSNSPKKQNVLTKIQFNIPEPFIEPLLQMGFSRNSASKALFINHLNVSDALDWLLMHTDSPNLDEPLTVEEVSALLGIRIPDAVADGAELNVQKTIDTLIKHRVCTASVTGKGCQDQTYYVCFTCSPNATGVGCCESCKEICHKGHQLSEPKHGNFFCDCGTGSLCGACKCLLSRKLARDIISPLVTDKMELD